MDLYAFKINQSIIEKSNLVEFETMEKLESFLFLDVLNELK